MPIRERWLAILSVCALGLGCSDQPTEANAGSMMASPQIPHASAAPDPRTYWRAKSTQELWSEIARGGNTAILGLKAPQAERGVVKGQVVIAPEEINQGVTVVSAMAGVEVLDLPDHLPILRVSIRDEQALDRLRALSHVDYLEPAFDFSIRPQSACGESGWDGEQIVISPGDVIGPHFVAMGIPRAWTRSNGEGIVIGSVDTGVDRG